MKAAYYNENDPQAARWLRELMLEGLIPPGDVDERSIRDVRGDDLRSYAQHHFFAGIGVWSYALRRAGWPDDEPVWTGSCPCQPFSAAGKQKGFEDERHLWPEFLRLIAERRPDRIVGEQVASAGAWLDLVRADLEALGYAFGAPELPAAGFGGAHIRQRTYWVADADHPERWAERAPGHVGDWPQTGRLESHGDAGVGRAILRLADSAGERWNGREDPAGTDGRSGAEDCGGLGHADDAGPQGRIGGELRKRPGQRLAGTPGGAGLAGADWLWCRDGFWRPVEAGTFPLADAAPARVGLLRGYGNALDAETAAEFLAAYMEAAELVRLGVAA